MKRVVEPKKKLKNVEDRKMGFCTKLGEKIMRHILDESTDEHDKKNETDILFINLDLENGGESEMKNIEIAKSFEGRLQDAVKAYGKCTKKITLGEDFSEDLLPYVAVNNFQKIIKEKFPQLTGVRLGCECVRYKLHNSMKECIKTINRSGVMSAKVVSCTNVEYDIRKYSEQIPFGFLISLKYDIPVYDTTAHKDSYQSDWFVVQVETEVEIEGYAHAGDLPSIYNADWYDVDIIDIISSDKVVMDNALFEVAKAVIERSIDNCPLALELCVRDCKKKELFDNILETKDIFKKDYYSFHTESYTTQNAVTKKIAGIK